MVGGWGAGMGERKTKGDATPLASTIRGVVELNGGKYSIDQIGLDTVEQSIFRRSPHLVFVPAYRGSPSYREIKRHTPRRYPQQTSRKQVYSTWLPRVHIVDGIYYLTYVALHENQSCFRV